MSYDDTLSSLSTQWRAQASELRRFGAVSQATVLEVVADELEAALVASANEPLPLESAARESGLSVAHLKRLLSQGKLRDVGTGGSKPLVARNELPRKRPVISGNLDSKAVSCMEQVARAAASGDC